MSEEQINIHLSGDQKEVIIRHGEALPQHDPEAIVITGQINAPSTFFDHRKEQIDPKKAIVIIDREKLSILLDVIPGDHFGTQIKGQLVINSELQAFGINGATTYTREQLFSLLKVNRFFFRDKDAHMKLLSDLKSFKANVQSDIHQASDNRGNKTNHFNKVVNTDVPFSFGLQIPVFKGEAPSTFDVDICFDVTDGSTKFWLESVELHEIFILKREDVFEAETKLFPGLVVLEK